MIKWNGIALPDAEEHLQEWMRQAHQYRDGLPTYQLGKLDAAMSHVRSWDVAVDVGAHVGLWTMHLRKLFGFVHAFEPVPEHRECFTHNVLGGNVSLHPEALGAAPGRAGMMRRTANSTGDTQICHGDAVEVRTLDSYHLDLVSFMKLDCEGSELAVLRGARETLLRCNPVVIVEQKPGLAEQHGYKEAEAVAFLQDLGAKLREVISGDYILSWEGRA